MLVAGVARRGEPDEAEWTEDAPVPAAPEPAEAEPPRPRTVAELVALRERQAAAAAAEVSAADEGAGAEPADGAGAVVAEGAEPIEIEGSVAEPLVEAVPEPRPEPDEEIVPGAGVEPPAAGGADDALVLNTAGRVAATSMANLFVLRGSDLLDSTPRQLMLHEALGQEPPRYAHVPLVHGPDGHRLSKRHKDLALAALRRMNVAPERVVGHLAHLYGLIDKPEPVKPAELVGTLDLSKLPGRPVTLPAKVMDGWEC